MGGKERGLRREREEPTNVKPGGQSIWRTKWGQRSALGMIDVAWYRVVGKLADSSILCTWVKSWLCHLLGACPEKVRAVQGSVRPPPHPLSSRGMLTTLEWSPTPAPLPSGHRTAPNPQGRLEVLGGYPQEQCSATRKRVGG